MSGTSERTILKTHKTCKIYHDGLCRKDTCFARDQLIGPIGALTGTACLMACTAGVHAAAPGLYTPIQDQEPYDRKHVFHINRTIWMGRHERNIFGFKLFIPFLRRWLLVSGICCSRCPFACFVLCVDPSKVHHRFPFSFQVFWFLIFDLTCLWYDYDTMTDCTPIAYLQIGYDAVNTTWGLMHLRDVKEDGQDGRFSELLSNGLLLMYRTMDKTWVYCNVHKSIRDL